MQVKKKSNRVALFCCALMIAIAVMIVINLQQRDLSHVRVFTIENFDQIVDKDDGADTISMNVFQSSNDITIPELTSTLILILKDNYNADRIATKYCATYGDAYDYDHELAFIRQETFSHYERLRGNFARRHQLDIELDVCSARINIELPYHIMKMEDIHADHLRIIRDKQVRSVEIADRYKEEYAEFVPMQIALSTDDANYADYNYTFEEVARQIELPEGVNAKDVRVGMIDESYAQTNFQNSSVKLRNVTILKRANDHSNEGLEEQTHPTAVGALIQYIAKDCQIFSAICGNMYQEEQHANGWIPEETRYRTFKQNLDYLMIEYNIHILNLSMGFYRFTMNGGIIYDQDTYGRRMEWMEDHIGNLNLIVIAAAGNQALWKDANGNPDTRVTAPATSRNVISVGAVTQSLQKRASFSSYGVEETSGLAYQLVKPEISAPGVSIYFEGIDFPVPPLGTTNFGSGTSFAAPLVSAAAALYLQKILQDPAQLGNKRDRVKAALLASADIYKTDYLTAPSVRPWAGSNFDKDTWHKHEEIGAGILNIRRLLLRVEDVNYQKPIRTATYAESYPIQLERGQDISIATSFDRSDIKYKGTLRLCAEPGVYGAEERVVFETYKQLQCAVRVRESGMYSIRYVSSVPTPYSVVIAWSVVEHKQNIINSDNMIAYNTVTSVETWSGDGHDRTVRSSAYVYRPFFFHNNVEPAVFSVYRYPLGTDWDAVIPREQNKVLDYVPEYKQGKSRAYLTQAGIYYYDYIIYGTQYVQYVTYDPSPPSFVLEVEGKAFSDYSGRGEPGDAGAPVMIYGGTVTWQNGIYEGDYYAANAEAPSVYCIDYDDFLSGEPIEYRLESGSDLAAGRYRLERKQGPGSPVLSAFEFVIAERPKLSINDAPYGTTGKALSGGVRAFIRLDYAYELPPTHFTATIREARQGSDETALPAAGSWNQTGVFIIAFESGYYGYKREYSIRKVAQPVLYLAEQGQQRIPIGLHVLESGGYKIYFGSPVISWDESQIFQGEATTETSYMGYFPSGFPLSADRRYDFRIHCAELDYSVTYKIRTVSQPTLTFNHAAVLADGVHTFDLEQGQKVTVGLSNAPGLFTLYASKDSLPFTPMSAQLSAGSYRIQIRIGTNVIRTERLEIQTRKPPVLPAPMVLAGGTAYQAKGTIRASKQNVNITMNDSRYQLEYKIFSWQTWNNSLPPTGIGTVRFDFRAVNPYTGAVYPFVVEFI